MIHITDSQIVRAMINKDSYGFNTLLATRVGEIQAKIDPHEWHWIESTLNIADAISRGAAINELNDRGRWQNGPEFLMLHVEEWPLRRDFASFEELPESSGYVVSATGDLKQNPIIEIDRFSNYIRLIRVTARMLCLRVINPKHSLSNISTSLKPHHTTIFPGKGITNSDRRRTPEGYEWKGCLSEVKC